MRHQFFVAMALLLASMDAQEVRGGDNRGLPIRDGRPVVAIVNDGSISLEELVLQLDPPFERARLLEGRGTAAELAILDRLIASRLIALEASSMGIGDLGEIRKQVDVYSRETLREVLLERVVKDIVPDEKAVEAAFRDSVRKWKTASLLFRDEASAREAQEAIAAGADYGAVAAGAVAGKTAQTQDDEEYHGKKEYLPEIAAALATLDAGQVSPVIPLQSGFVVLKVVDVRYPENEEARAEARSAVVRRQQQEAISAFEQALRADLVVVHKDVIDDLDYEKTSGDALSKDTRVLADIKGATPVTVGDLTDYMRMQFFHGGDESAQGKRLNARKGAALDATIGRRLLNAEALRRGIDKTEAYVDRVNAFEESLVFGAFVEKVIAPESKVRDEEIRTYYEQHLKDYSSPGMIRMRSLAFTERAAAEGAIAKLRNGADYGWLASTAEGQVDKDAGGLLTFDGRPVTTDSLPDGMQKALANPKPDDVRLYASPEGPFYLLAIQQVITTAARPYEEVKKEIAQRLFAEKLMKGIDEYAGKLRAVSRVETYLKKAE